MQTPKYDFEMKLKPMLSYILFSAGKSVRLKHLLTDYSAFSLFTLKNKFDMPTSVIAPDKAAYCVFTQFRVPENAIKLISVRTKTQ